MERKILFANQDALHSVNQAKGLTFLQAAGNTTSYKLHPMMEAVNNVSFSLVIGRRDFKQQKYLDRSYLKAIQKHIMACYSGAYYNFVQKQHW